MKDPVSPTEVQPDVILRIAQDSYEHRRYVTRGPAVLPARDKVRTEGEPDDISLYGADPPWI